MAFDFINQAIDKVVGAGKAVKDVATTAVDDWKAGADSIKKSITTPAKAKVDASVVQEIKNGGKLDNSLINALVDKAINLTIPKGVVNDVVTGALHQPSAQEVKQKVDAGIPITEAIHQLKVSEPLANYVGKTISPVTTKATDLGLINQGQANQILSNAQGTAQFLGGNLANLAPLESGVRKGVSEVKDVFNRENDTRSLKGKATDLLVGLSRPVVGGLQSYMSVTPKGILATTAIGGVNKLTGFDKYQEKVIDNAAKKISEDTGASYEDAKNRVSGIIGGLSTASGFKTAGAIGKIGSKQAAAESIVRNELKASGTKATQKEVTDLAKNIQDAVTPAQQLKSNIKEGLKATSWATAPQVVNDILAATTGTESGDIVNQAKLYTAAGLSNIVGTKTGGGKKPKASSSIDAEPAKPIKVDETINTQVKEATPVTDTYNLKTKKSAYNFITNQKRFDEKGIVYKASTSDGKEVYGNLDIHNKKMVLRIPNSNQVYSVMSIDKIDSTPIKVSDIPVQKEVTPTPEPSKVEVPTIKATPSMALGKPSVQGNSKAVYTTDDPNITQIVRSAIISNKGTAKTAPEHTNALTEAGFSPEEIGLIRDFSVRVADKNGYINSEGMKNFLTSLKNRQPEATTATTQVASVVDNTPTKSNVVPTPEKAIPTPEAKAELPASPEPEPTPDVNQSLASLVDTYKGDGTTKGKIGNIQVDFENALNKTLYSLRESKNKLKPKDESALQELARLSGLDEASIRKLGEDVATKIKDKIYREKAVTPEGVKLDSTKADTNVPKEDDILGLNDTPAPKEKVVSPLTQRYQELIANNEKEGDALSRAKGIFDFTPTGKVGNFFQKTFDKIGANIDRIASTKTFLNNFRVGEGKELAGNYVESKQARDHSQLYTSSIDEFDMVGKTKELGFTPKREVTEKDFVGSVTPNGFALNEQFAKEAFDTYRLDSEKFIDRTTPLIAKGVSSKDILQAVRNSAIYKSFKNDPVKLNEFFTPEQIAVLQKQEAGTPALQSAVVKAGQDIGFFPKEIDAENGYLRQVTTARAAERAGKLKGTDDGKIEVTLSDGTVIRADTMEEALRLSLLKRDSENFNPENMSSLTKKQAGPEYDPFRLQGDYASTLSLIDAMSKLYADKNAIKFVDGLIEKGDPNYTGAMKTKAYNLMAKDVLGIRGTAKSEGSAETHLGTAANLGTKGAMLVNVGNATTNIVPSYLRTLMRSSMDLVATAAARGIKEGWEGVKGAFKDANLSQITKSMGDERVDARLRGLGLVNEYNIDNGSPYGKIEGQLMYMSNGTWAEIPGSKLAATLSMANSLNRAGRLEGAKDANDVIDRWEAWQKEGGQDFYEARGALDDQLRSLGKTGSTDKVNIPYVPASVNDILGKLKTWAVVQAMAQKEGINTVARSAIEKVFQKDRSYSNRQVEESIKDLGARYATYLATSAAMGTLMQATGIFDENDDPEYKKLIIDEATRKIAPDPTVPYLWTLEQAVMSDSAATSTILNGGKAAFQLLAAIKNQIEGDKKESDVYLRDALANLGKIGTVRNVSDIVGTFNKGDSLQDIVANKFGTFSKEEATRTGVASGKNWNSSLDRGLKLFGINGEQARIDALHRMKNNLDAPDWVKSVPGGGLIYQAIQREVKPAIDFFDDTKNSSGGGDLMENGIRAGYAYDVVKDLHNSKDSAEFFQKNGLEGKDEMVQELMKNLITSNISQNKNVDERYEQLVQGISSQTFLQDMEKLRGLDPYLYNNVVATLGELKEIKDQAGSLSPEVLNRRVIDRIKNKTNSISQEDYAIAQANDDYALTTSFTNAIGKDITKINKDLDDSKPQEAKEKMDNLEKLSAVMNSPSIYAYKIPFANLIANNATDIKKAFTILGADPNSYPFLKNAMLFGAKVVRGAADTGQSAPPAPVSNTPVTPLSGTTLSSMVRKPVIIDKPATVSNITIDKPLKVGQLKIDPTLVKLPTSQQGASLSNQTLSSMVKRKTPKL